MTEESTKPSAPEHFYGLFAGSIDQQAVMRFHNALSLASRENASHIHLLFQCSGGIVGDGISLYNLFRACPVDLTLYNVGSVCSIGVIAFLGAKHRKTSKYGTFMIHKAYLGPVIATADKFVAHANQMAIDDARIEAILKTETKIAADKWDVHKYADVWFSADDAIQAGIADGFGEFAPVVGKPIFNVWGQLPG